MIQTIEPTDVHMASAAGGYAGAAGLVEAIREPVERTRREAERMRRLPDRLVDALRAAGAFRLATPVELGGYELTLREAVDVYEHLGQLDGPVAWNVWNGNMGFCAALLGHEGAGAIWAGADPQPIIANSARPAGTAQPTADGYVLTGRWDIVSAIDIADWVALFALVVEGGSPRLTPHGAPDVQVMFLPRGDFDVLDTWHTTGMRATGSNTVVVDTVHVPTALAVSPFAPGRIDRPLFRVPAFTIASTGVAGVVLGIAQSAVDAVVRLAVTKPTDDGRPLAQRPHAQAALGAAQASLDAARALLHAATADVDGAALAGDPVDIALRARLRAAMSWCGSVSREVLATCHQLASSTAVYADQPIARIVTDGMVAAQHMLLAPTHLEIRSRMMLGLDPGTPLV